MWKKFFSDPGPEAGPEAKANAWALSATSRSYLSPEQAKAFEEEEDICSFPSCFAYEEAELIGFADKTFASKGTTVISDFLDTFGSPSGAWGRRRSIATLAFLASEGIEEGSVIFKRLKRHFLDVIVSPPKEEIKVRGFIDFFPNDTAVAERRTNFFPILTLLRREEISENMMQLTTRVWRWLDQQPQGFKLISLSSLYVPVQLTEERKEVALGVRATMGPELRGSARMNVQHHHGLIEQVQILRVFYDRSEINGRLVPFEAEQPLGLVLNPFKCVKVLEEGQAKQRGVCLGDVIYSLNGLFMPDLETLLIFYRHQRGVVWAYVV